MRVPHEELSTLCETQRTVGRSQTLFGSSACRSVPSTARGTFVRQTRTKGSWESQSTTSLLSTTEHRWKTQSSARCTLRGSACPQPWSHRKYLRERGCRREPRRGHKTRRKRCVRSRRCAAHCHLCQLPSTCVNYEVPVLLFKSTAMLYAVPVAIPGMFTTAAPPKGELETPFKDTVVPEGGGTIKQKSFALFTRTVLSEFTPEIGPGFAFPAPEKKPIENCCPPTNGIPVVGEYCTSCALTQATRRKFIEVTEAKLDRKPVSESNHETSTLGRAVKHWNQSNMSH